LKISAVHSAGLMREMGCELGGPGLAPAGISR
jgi:hypothetical protein